MDYIEFYSVFEANRGLALLRLHDPKNPQWEYRDHNYGSLKYSITPEQLRILKDNNVGFMMLPDK